MSPFEQMVLREGDKIVRFRASSRSFEVRTRVHGRANTIFECEVGGDRKYFKVPLSDPTDLPKSFGEAETFATRLELNLPGVRAAFALMFKEQSTDAKL